MALIRWILEGILKWKIRHDNKVMEMGYNEELEMGNGFLKIKLLKGETIQK